MWKDPIVEEVRAASRQIEEECGNDWDALFAYYRKAQRKWARTHKLVSLAPKRRRGPAPTTR